MPRTSQIQPLYCYDSAPGVVLTVPGGWVMHRYAVALWRRVPDGCSFPEYVADEVEAASAFAALAGLMRYCGISSIAYASVRGIDVTICYRAYQVRLAASDDD